MVVELPAAQGESELAPKQDELLCHACTLRYPIKDVPVVLIEGVTKINRGTKDPLSEPLCSGRHSLSQ